MADIRFVFPGVTRLTAGAVGALGQRTFYILVGRGDNLVRLWVEKAQLQTMSAVIGRFLLLLSPSLKGKPEEASAMPPHPDETPTADLQGGQLALSYDAERQRFVFLAHEREAPEEAHPALSFWATPPQMRGLSHRIEEVCAAGRPLCPLCAGPIDPAGHVCPRGNGHRSLDALGPQARGEPG